MDSGRTRLVAVVILVVASAGLIAVALAGGGGSGEPSGLKLELAPNAPGDLVVSVSPASNVPSTAAGRRTVTLECFDRDDKLVARSRQAWPFSNTDAASADPHVHQFVPPERARALERCRLVGTKGPLEGRVSAPVG